MKRDIIKIDEELCNGCGDCVPNCYEGALQIIDGKVRLISELMCDGLGACIGHCPEGAITIEKREAQPYNEIVVIKDMIKKGKNVIVAHLKHLEEHGETAYLQQGVRYLEEHRAELDFDLDKVKYEVNHGEKEETLEEHAHEGGCPGAVAMSFGNRKNENEETKQVKLRSELTQWPIQMHLVNPVAPYFRDSDLLLVADCVAYALGDFHQEHLKGKSLAIACPKLDSSTEVYVEKIHRLIDEAKVNTITVMMMEVPCCGGLLQMVKLASDKSQRKVPVKAVIVGIKGEILSEEFV